MSYRNRTGLCGLLIGGALALASACGGLDNVKVVITDDAGSGGANPSGGAKPSGGANPSGGTPTAGGTSTEGGEAGAGTAGSAGAAGEASGEGGEGGALPIPDPMPGPPQVVLVSPRDASTGNEPLGNVRISFSEPLDPNTVTSDSVQIKDESGAVVTGTLTYADAVATFNPKARMNLLGNYTVNVAMTVTDAGGTPMERPFQSAFTIRDGTWSRTDNPLTSSTQTFERNSPQSLATDGAGHVVAVWAQSTDGTTMDIYAAFFLQGKGWATPVKVNTNAANCSYPSVSMNASGSAIVGWIESDPVASTWSVQARRNVAGTWDALSTRIDIPGSITFTIYPTDVAVAITNNGHAHVAWDCYYYDSTATVDYYSENARHVDDKGMWDANQTALTYWQVGSGSSPPSLAFDAAGNGFAAYQLTSNASPTKVTTFVSRYLVTNNKWGSSANNSTVADGYAQPVALATNAAGDAVMAYARATTTDPSTGAANYDLIGNNYSKAWGSPVVISSAKTNLASVKTLATATWTGKSFLVAWAQSAGNLYNVYANELKTTWGTMPTIISDGNHNAILPWLSGDGRGNALAVWSQSSDAMATTTVTPSDVVFSRFLGSSDTWAAPRNVSNEFAGYRYSQVVTLADGTSVAAWQRWTRPTIKSTAVTGVLENDFQ
jgi:hypothetical protein